MARLQKLPLRRSPNLPLKNHKCTMYAWGNLHREKNQIEADLNEERKGMKEGKLHNERSMTARPYSFFLLSSSSPPHHLLTHIFSSYLLLITFSRTAQSNPTQESNPPQQHIFPSFHPHKLPNCYTSFQLHSTFLFSSPYLQVYGVNIHDLPAFLSPIPLPPPSTPIHP